MKKRIISLLLAVAVVMSMIVVPVGAYDNAGRAGVTSATGTCPCSCGLPLDKVTWKPWNPNASSDLGTGHYYLEGNYAQDAEVNIISGSEVVLDLRGYTLTTSAQARIATVNGYFAVLDTVGGGALRPKIASGSSGNGGAIVVKVNETANPTFKLLSGTITPADGSSTPSSGGLIYVYEGSIFDMTGGMLLSGQSAYSGGLICADSNTVVNITGGSLIGGTSGTYGGSLYSKGKVTLHDCQLIGGSAGKAGGQIYITTSSAKLTATNCVIKGGIAYCDGVETGGGNVALGSKCTSTFTNCTITDGYSAYSGGNLYFGSGKHTITGGTVSAGTCAINGNNIYSSANLILDGCDIAGDVEYNSTNTLTLKGKLKIGLLNTGLNIADTGAQVNASGLTGDAEIYLNADGATVANADIAYFKPAIRTVLTVNGAAITTSQAADGKTAGYCPHCKKQVAWNAFNTTGVTTTGGHFYVVDNTDLSSPLAIGENITKSNVDSVVDLNGKTITCADRFAYIYSTADHSLTLLDSAGGGMATGKGTTKVQSGGMLYNQDNLTIYGGTYRFVTSSDRSAGNGSVVSNGGVFNMYGGILDGSAYNRDDALALKSSVTCNGGALYMGSGATRKFNMSAGCIIGGTATNGGSVYIHDNNVVSITGGTITGGAASEKGGNIYVYYEEESSGHNAKVDISGCFITGGTAPAAGNIYIGNGICNITDCYIAGGTVSASGGNISFGGYHTVKISDSIIIDGNANKGGNLYTAGKSVKLTLTNCLLACGKAAESGGNMMTNNGTITVEGGTFAYGVAGIYGGNIHANAGSSATYYHTKFITDSNAHAPLLVGGSAEKGGNLSVKGNVILTAAHIIGGSATGNGQDIFFYKAGDVQNLTIGSGVVGDNILFYAEESTHLTDPVFGTAILYTACDTLNATMYLENDGYGNPMLIAENGALCVGAIAVQQADGGVQWFTTADDAMAAYKTGEVLMLATDCELTLNQDCIIDVCGSTVTVHGDYKVIGMDTANDNYALSEGKLIFAGQEVANTDPVTYAPNGNMYIAKIVGNEATYHRLDFGIEAISIRPTNCGVYYNGVWSGDETLANMVDSFGIALSLTDMPTVDFRNDDDCKYTESEESFAAGTNDTSVLISGIMQSGETYGDEAQTPVSAETNDRRGRMPIYATAYITINGTTYISDDSTTKEDDVNHSLYSAMALLDDLITNKPERFRRNSNAIRDFYDIWDTYGMESWDFEQIYIPTEDDVIDVLMIGSSFCYYYVEELVQLAKAAGLEMRVCNVYYSGGALDQHYDWWLAEESNYQFYETTLKSDGTVSRVKTDPASLELSLMQGDWDVISLQESSSRIRRSGTAEAHFKNTQRYHETLVPYLQEQFPNARLVWHQTWAVQIGYLSAGGYEMKSYEQQQSDTAKMQTFSEMICEEYDIDRVPSGTAWMNVRDGDYGDAYDNLCARLSKRNGIGDYYHDGDIGGGQYLNACVWFETITGIDCREIDSYIPTFEYSGTLSDAVLAATNLDKVDGGYALTAEFVDLLQECAHAAVEEVYPER